MAKKPSETPDAAPDATPPAAPKSGTGKKPAATPEHFSPKELRDQAQKFHGAVAGSGPLARPRRRAAIALEELAVAEEAHGAKS